MKCFNHHDRDAFGVCIACQKALCKECLELIENRICCKGSDFCNKVTLLIHKTLGFNEEYIPMAQKSLKFMFLRYVFVLIIGLLFTGWGILYLFNPDINTPDKISAFILLSIGLAFIFITVKLIKPIKMK